MKKILRMQIARQHDNPDSEQQQYAASGAESRGQKLCLNVREASWILGISLSHLKNLISTGSLRTITIGRSRRIPAKSLDEYVTDRLNAGPGV